MPPPSPPIDSASRVRVEIAAATVALGLSPTVSPTETCTRVSLLGSTGPAHGNYAPLA